MTVLAATQRLGDLCDVVAGGTPPRTNLDYFGGDVPWVKIGDMLQGHIRTTDECLTEEGLAACRAKVLPPGTLLVSIFATIGRTAVLDIPAATNQAIVGVMPRDRKVLDPTFLRYFLDLHAITLGRQSRGVAQSNINASMLKDVPVPIPFPDDPRRSLAEQKRIAAILDKADAIRRRRQEAARLADTLIPSVFYEMFGDPVTNAKQWPVESLDQVAQLDRGRSRHRPRDWAPLYGGPYPLIQTGDIANCNGVIRKYTQTYSEEGLAQSKLWPKGTLCITIAANIGKTGILAFDACFPDSVVGLVAGPRLTIEYVREWFVAIQKNLDDSAPQVAQKNINLAILNALEIPVPPKPLQERFTRAVTELRDAQEHIAAVLAEADTLFNSVVQRAFRGEL